MPPTIISGDIREHDPEEFRKTLVAARIDHIDTAARYADGASQTKLGAHAFGKDFTIDSKVWTTLTGEECLTDEAIAKSLDNSLKQLGISQLNTLYCHAPDPTTPIAVSARAFDRQFRAGKFKQLGLSNHSPQAVIEWLNVATKEGLVKPSVYQGQYNLICRGFEESLFPLLREHGIRFFAYSPLAGGFLLGGYTPTSGEQSPGGSTRLQKAANYRNWYVDEPSMHEAVSELRKISAETGVGMDELSLRWLRYHSKLEEGDAVLVGASKVAQIQLNVAQLRGGPLPEDIIASRLSGLWGICKEAGQKIVDF